MKRKAPKAVDSTLRDAVLQRDGGCVARLVGGLRCWGRLDPHHIDPKGMGGRHRDDVLEDLVTLCRTHHDWVHRHVSEAIELGLLV
jgi:hypothetical protein